MSIVVKNLLKTYGLQQAVNNISFTVNAGEIVGFLGPNGAGKSTTMKMITGYVTPDAGQISVSGIDVLNHPLEVKKKIGYLPESNALYYDMYIREYLDFIAGVNGVSNKKDAVADVITLTGLTPESRKKIGQLSKGYKQRVGLAAALLHQPEVLILDEPTSGLDPNQIVEIRQVIKDQGKNKLVLFSSHILQEVEAICDRVIIINKGSIVADDTVQNLRKATAGKTTIILELKEVVDIEVLQPLSNDPVKRLSDTKWKFETEQPETLKKRLLELSLQNNLNIVSLQSETVDLEEVFRSLTNNAASVPLESTAENKINY
jgi:ABC-2 type transport system ATP-binding protein